MRTPCRLSCAGSWNHNTHYYPLALDAAPCERALDVGCGDGLLLRLLAPHCAEVVGVDPWADLAIAATRDLPNVDVLTGDFLDTDLAPQSFDLVAASPRSTTWTSTAPCARWPRSCVPAGGLWWSASPPTPTGSTGLIGGLGDPRAPVLARRRGYWEHPAPVRDSDLTYRQVRAAVAADPARRATYRRRLYWRYSITWTRPA